MSFELTMAVFAIGSSLYIYFKFLDEFLDERLDEVFKKRRRR